MSECRTCRHGCKPEPGKDGCADHSPLRLYIVGPFTHPTQVGEAFNVAAAVKVWHRLTDAGYHAFCPQAVSGPLDAYAKRDPEFWYRWTMEELRRSDAVCLVPDDSLHTRLIESHGCAMELDEAEARGMRVYELADLVEVLA